MNYYDLSIIGAGWAGFNAAIRASQLGLKVLLIDHDQLGGTCLNYGCIPTKSLIQSAKVLKNTKNTSRFGIELNNGIDCDFKKIQSRKVAIVEQLKNGMRFLLKSKNIEYLKGRAEFISDNELSIEGKKINTKNVLIATGSVPSQLSSVRFDSKKILSSKEVLNLSQIPESMLIIGGGVIGCEFASLFNLLGTKVSLVEFMPSLLPQEDKEISKRLESIFKKRGIKVFTSTDAAKFDFSQFQTVLLSVGRVANTTTLNFNKTKIAIEKGSIKTDEYLKTTRDNIYAAGDCSGKIMLAHYAAYQGWNVAENIASPQRSKKIINTVVPSCIFTTPEIGRVGLTEEEALKQNIKFQISKFDFLGSGMARIKDATEGFSKIIWEKDSQQVIGASIIGGEAVELIAILTLAISNRLKVSQVASTIFAHPTLSESISEQLKENLL